MSSRENASTSEDRHRQSNRSSVVAAAKHTPLSSSPRSPRLAFQKQDDDDSRKPAQASSAKKKQKDVLPSLAAAPPPAVALEQVKQLGQKARERRDAERGKRREIVRINNVPATTTITEDSDKPTILWNGPESSPRAKKRRRIKNTTTKTEKAANAESKKSVDFWMPDLSCLQTCCSKTGCHSSSSDVSIDEDEDENAETTEKSTTTMSHQRQRLDNKRQRRSNLVWLHGLPKRTTPGQIRRFFSGLEPQRILLLPSNPVWIPAWDANHNEKNNNTSKSNTRKKKDAKQNTSVYGLAERYPPHTRVLVQFETAATAEIAARRAGEVFQFSTTKPSSSLASSSTTTSTATTEPALAATDAANTVVHDDGDGDGACCIISGCSIGVTHVIRPVALVAKQMGIDGEVGFPLETTLEKVQRAMTPLVARVLWADAARDLGLQLEKKKYSDSQEEDEVDDWKGQDNDATFYYPLDEHSNDVVPYFDTTYSSTASMTDFATKRRTLMADYQRLLYSRPSPFLPCCGAAAMLDPELLSADPVARLTNKAARILLDEAQRMDELLLQARNCHRLLLLLGENQDNEEEEGIK